MPLLPVYDWLGIDLTNRQKLAVNTLALGIVLGVLAGGFGLDVITGLPPVSRLLVLGMAFLATVTIGLTILEHDLSSIAWITAGAVSGFFLLDLFYVHVSVFSNVPSLFYWLVKPFWVAVPMFITAWYLITRTDLSRGTSYLIAGITGIISLQSYYTVVPIPIVNGPSIQIGVVGNLTTGLQVHGVFLVIALAAVVIGVRVFGE